MWKKWNHHQKDIAVLIIATILGLILICAYLFVVFTESPPAEVENIQESNHAKELIYHPEPSDCISDYLGIYEVENFGKIEIFCENGQYFGQISDIFSISMVKTQHENSFRAVFCKNDTCYAHPVVFEDGNLHSMYPGIVFLEGVP